jgi:NAD(P)-dependent dehydrogenase (short-subunit alcohol dehydrogenase family)
MITDDLSGRVVIVAHADTQHGAEIARVVCSSGASAVLTGTHFRVLGTLAEELHGDTGAAIAIFAGDLSRADERQVLSEMVQELFPV